MTKRNFGIDIAPHPLDRVAASNPTPSAREFFEALVDVVASGQPRRVGNTTLDPRREWPTSATALYGLALDMAAAERREVAA